MELTDAIRQYLESKLNSLSKFMHADENSVICDAELEAMTSHSSDEIFRAEVNCEVSGEMIRAEASNADLYAAIDAIHDELSRQLREGNDKKQKLHRDGAREAKDILHGTNE